MPLILCIETGTEICSVALARDGAAIALREEDAGRDHARNVAGFTQEVLTEAAVRATDLAAVAVSEGPGSYTGLRIGVSFAKGLCYALGIPLVAVGSLESLARRAAELHETGGVNVKNWTKAVLCPMIDARRMEVYTQLFDTSLRPLGEAAAIVLTEESFGDYLSAGKEFVILGNGAAKSLEVLPAGKVQYLNIKSSALSLCRIAEEKLKRGETENTAYFEPFYLKEFVVTKSNKKIF